MNYYLKYTAEQVEDAIGLVLAGKAVVITNCPNCGAPVNGEKCAYCGTVLVANQNGWQPKAGEGGTGGNGRICFHHQ